MRKHNSEKVIRTLRHRHVKTKKLRKYKGGVREKNKRKSVAMDLEPTRATSRAVKKTPKYSEYKKQQTAKQTKTEQRQSIKSDVDDLTTAFGKL